MAAYMDKVQLNTAITDNTKFDLGFDHVTTGGFFQFTPVMIREMVPGEHIKVKSEVFSRLQPLIHPTFGRCNINIRGFFVPMRTVWTGWNEFIVDTQSTISKASWDDQVQSPSTNLNFNVPYTTSGELMDMILMQCGYQNIDATFPYPQQGPWPWGDIYTSDPGNADFLFVYTHTNPQTDLYIVLNYYGRQALKILENLGYRLGCIKDTKPGNVSLSNGADMISAMPILSLAKIYVDWFVNSQYLSTEAVVRLVDSLTKCTAQTSSQIRYDVLGAILAWIMCTTYDSDYFISAWDNPVGPTTGLYSTLTFIDVTNNAASGVVQGVTNANAGLPRPGTTHEPTNGTPYVGSSVYSSVSQGWAAGAFTQYVDTALHALTDYMKRHQLSGAHVFDRYLARFGKVLSPEKQKRCLYLGSHKTGVQFGDVMQTMQDTPGSSNNEGLGNYAGKGLAFSQGGFDYSTDEYGYLILVSTIVPASGYYQGISRHIKHLANTDFWTPEFDNLGVQAMSASELYVSNNGQHTLGNLGTMWDKVFGYVPRYAEYKVSRDMLSGDFARPSINAGMNSWHMFREFNDTQFGNLASNVSHSVSFTRAIMDGDQYNRIFQNWNASSLQAMTDMFWLIYHFDIVDYAPMKSLYDTYEFCDKGKVVTEEVNGVKMN